MTAEIDYERVHAAMKRVGEHLNEQRLARIAARNAAHIAAGGRICRSAEQWPLQGVCTRPAIGFYLSGWRCQEHTPAKLAGHPEPPTPTCAKPLLCYRECCAVKTEPAPVEKRHELDERIAAWKAHARAEILQLASLGYPFGPRDLAALLPVKLAGDSARDWLMQLLDEGVTAGALARVGDTEWKGARA